MILNKISLMMFSLFSLSESFSKFNKPIFVTGSTSNLGKNVVDKLTNKGYNVRCFIRDKEKALDLYEDNEQVSLVKGNILDIDSLNMAIYDCSMVIAVHGSNYRSNITNIGKINDKLHPYFVNYIGTKNIADACSNNNISKIVRVTEVLSGYSEWNPLNILFNVIFSNRIHWNKKSEEYIKDSGLTYTIIRPGVIKEKNFNGFKIYNDKTSLPAIIDIKNLANVIALCSISIDNKIFDNKTIACNGV